MPLIEPHFAQADSLTVGLIADTHMPGTILNLWPQVHAAFAGVDCILHAGDLHVAGVIDELEQIAPTYVCTGNGDLDVQHPRLQETWLGHLAGQCVGLVHRFPTPRRANAARLDKKISQFFPAQDPRIVIYGHTHLAELHAVGSRIFVNPGSATLPNNQSTRLGTLGILQLSPHNITIQLHQLTDHGHTPIDQLTTTP